jgi:two-component system phosphate regulon sensor histidine kinase PhoR
MTRLTWQVVLWAICCWLGAKVIGPTPGWVIFALGLVAVLLYRQKQLQAVAGWARDVNAPPPAVGGQWDAILAPVYRKLRMNDHDLDLLRRQTQGIMQAAEALPDGAMTLDDAMQMTWCNQTACRHFGLNPATDQGRSIFNIVRHPEFAQYARQADWPGPIELRYGKDGQDTTLQVRLIPYGLNRVLLVTRDITQMERLETTRTDFVANVSHELRTPLTVLGGFLETLHDAPEGALTREQRTHYLDLMREQAARMQSIVADLLALSRLESAPALDGEPIDMGRLIATALDQARLLPAQQHIFKEDIDAGLAITGSADEIASAVLNLLTNAVRYTPAGGTITVSWARMPDGRACCSVADTGIGIAQHNIGRLTERFFRVDRGRSRATGGTGLGLAITKHVAMRHQARLTIESRVNVGSRFSLEFPAQRVIENSAKL